MTLVPTPPIDFDNLPQFEFRVSCTIQQETSLRSWYMNFMDPTWTSRSVLGGAQPPNSPVEFLIDENVATTDAEIANLPSTENNMELVQFIHNAPNLHLVKAGTSKLTSDLQHELRSYVQSFRQLQGVLILCGATVTGSFLLWFLFKTEDWHPGDLDIHIRATPDARATKILLGYLRQDGYVLRETLPLYQLAMGQSRVFKLYNAARRKRIDVIEHGCENAVLALSAFHSTIVQNGLSGRHLLIMQPQWTSQRKALAAPTLPARIRAKYEERDISFVMNNTDWTQPCGLLCPRYSRSACRVDSSWMIPLSETWAGVESSVFPPLQEWTGPFPCTNVLCANCDVPCGL